MVCGGEEYDFECVGVVICVNVVLGSYVVASHWSGGFVSEGVEVRGEGTI